MIEKYKKIPDLPTGSPMDDDLIPFVKLSTNQTMKAPKASLMGAQAIAVAFVDNDMVFTLTNGEEISLLNAKLQLRGEAGDEVQLRKTSTHLQWKLIEATEWTDIVSLAEITGPKGDVGAKIVGAGFNGNDLVFILDDASTVTITDGRLAIKGDTGASITSGAFEMDDIVFLKDDGTTVTLANAKATLKGDKGDAATIALGTVQTGEAGSEVSITNAGTPDAATFNFVIPRGNKGETGAKVTSVAFSGNDIVFTLEDETTVTLTDAKLSLKGDTGDTGETGASITSAAFVGNDLVFTKDDESTVTLTNALVLLQGPQGETGETGATGKGIVSIAKTGTAGRVDTYTITYSDSTSTTFDVTNGEDGEGSGDMCKSVYDPTNINGSAFDMDKMVQGATNLFVSAAEKAAWSAKQNALGFTPEDVANKGEASGYAELDENGKVPSSQLPSYVDDVLEYANAAALPVTGETGKIYITLDDNKTFRWSGSAYVEISASLALGETQSTAYRGDKGKIAYDHSQLLSGNPHGVSKADVGLENVDNTTDAEKPVSTAQQAALDEKQATLPKGTDGQLLTLSSGLPEWVDPSGSVPEAGVAVSDGSDWDASLQVIDPDNIAEQSAGYLVGGTGHSALSVFQSLGAGANDGKFKINIDGTIYDNVEVDLNISSEMTISQTQQNQSKNSWNNHAQSFNSGNLIEIISISFYAYAVTANHIATLKLRRGEGLDGEIIGTGTVNLYGNGEFTVVFDTPITVEKNTMYTFTFSGLSNYDSYSAICYQNTDVYSDGHCWISGVEQVSYDLYFKVNGNEEDIGKIATKLQDAIRAATSSLETVIYDTDHFKITSAYLGSTSKVLKLMTPSTGTDISGAGETPYLDCADNATEVLGTGEDYNLVRLDKDGKMLTSLIRENELYEINPSDEAIVSANTQRSTSATTYTKLKEITINKTGRYRVYFGLRGSNSSVSSDYGKIYKNGDAIGTERNNNSPSTYTYFSEDFNFVAGDKVQLYAYTTNANYPAYVSSFQIRAGLIPASVGSVDID